MRAPLQPQDVELQMRVARSVRALASPAARIPVGRQACRGCVWHRFVCVYYCVNRTYNMR
jgi:hypothetical protein